MIPREQFDKLPKYIKNEINSLNNQIKLLELKLNPITESETNVFIQKGSNLINLPKDSRIRFFKNTDDHVTCYLDINSKMLEIRSSYNIKIIPGVSNLIYIDFN